MTDSFVHFYLSLNPAVRWIIETIFYGVLIKKILAHKATIWVLREISLLEQHETSIVKAVMRHLSTWTVVSRKVALVQHYRQGHEHDGVLGCTEGNCNVFEDTRSLTQPITA